VPDEDDPVVVADDAVTTVRDRTDLGLEPLPDA
jgi:hypothetical protein